MLLAGSFGFLLAGSGVAPLVGGHADLTPARRLTCG
jgi:hypothetical protein